MLLMAAIDQQAAILTAPVLDSLHSECRRGHVHSSTHTCDARVPKQQIPHAESSCNASQ